MAETIAHIIYKNGTTVGFCLESDPVRAQVYAEVAYRPGPDEWVTVVGLTLTNGLTELERSVKTLESLRPHWAQGYTSDSMAAQASTAALSQLWEMLGATDQTEAVQRVTILQGVAKGEVWVTPRHRRHYAVHSVSGAHIGLWPARETAVEVLRDYPGGTLTELVETGPPNAMPTLSAFVDEHNAVEALRLHVAYEALPTDRGGKNGPKGKAWAAFIAARDKVLANG